MDGFNPASRLTCVPIPQSKGGEPTLCPFLGPPCSSDMWGLPSSGAQRRSQAPHVSCLSNPSGPRILCDTHAGSRGCKHAIPFLIQLTMAHNGIIGSSGPPLLDDDGISDQQRPASPGDTAHAQTKQGCLG